MLIKHALRAALIPIVSLVGIFAISLIGSSVLVEEVFARPGLGKLMVGATKQKDYTTLQSIMVVYALIIVVINIIVDIIYTYVDPRVRYSLMADIALANAGDVARGGPRRAQADFAAGAGASHLPRTAPRSSAWS